MRRVLLRGIMQSTKVTACRKLFWGAGQVRGHQSKSPLDTACSFTDRAFSVDCAQATGRELRASCKSNAKRCPGARKRVPPYLGADHRRKHSLRRPLLYVAEGRDLPEDSRGHTR